ncbi:hypothetical protein T4B_3833 [Trichinella pseudospiralis]|uniref:Uncharacterized protein n=1 Tax=Trichinella pseudospiralis TaxID=6337 RepID=A0A0V1GA11_TRIPS|nr:hypothetical protein T4B_3833 [Trichinella pseudospiralis]
MIVSAQTAQQLENKCPPKFTLPNLIHWEVARQ